MPAVTFNRAIVEYCCRALARCAAAVSNADTLRTLPMIQMKGSLKLSVKLAPRKSVWPEQNNEGRKI